MMNAIEYKALQINKIIKESPTYQEYVLLKESISQKYELQETELKELQQELVKLAYSDEVALENKKGEYFVKKAEFYNDPLIKQFISAYKEVQKMITSIKSIIEAEV